MKVVRVILAFTVIRSQPNSTSMGDFKTPNQGIIFQGALKQIVIYLRDMSLLSHFPYALIILQYSFNSEMEMTQLRKIS